LESEVLTVPPGLEYLHLSCQFRSEELHPAGNRSREIEFAEVRKTYRDINSSVGLGERVKSG
jgi:hypothetical protein